MGMSVVVEVDAKGRILLPIEARRKFRSRRFKITTMEDTLELRPLPSADEVRGKYKSVIKSDWDELEERTEELVSRGRR